MTDTPQLVPETPHAARFAPERLWELLKTSPGKALMEMAVLLLVSGYFLLFGLVPYFGGDQLGLVGADEPRYAQIAREMLALHSTDCHEVHARVIPHSLRPKQLHNSYVCLVGGTVTPILYGKPWLEKPALYYWRAMGFFKEFGVSDWSARLPSTTATAALSDHARVPASATIPPRRPSGRRPDHGLLPSPWSASPAAPPRTCNWPRRSASACSAGTPGTRPAKSSGSSTSTSSAPSPRSPKAPSRRSSRWSSSRSSSACAASGPRCAAPFWIPGVLLYLVIVLPWYIAVQRRNPGFAREFFLQHNLERFATNLYQHHQPPYYYLVVLILGMMPWTAIAFRALWDGIHGSIIEWKTRFKPQRYVGHVRPGDAFPEFLVLWALFPIAFFTFSTSKLPGYVLPSLPPLAILAGDFLFRSRRAGLAPWLLNTHGIMAGILTFVLALCPQYMVYQRIFPQPLTFALAALAGIVTALSIIFTVRHFGVRHLRTATLIPLGCLLFFLLGVNGHLLDLNYSARPLARQIAQTTPATTLVAVPDVSGANDTKHDPAWIRYGVRRDVVYGLSFYRNQAIVNYSVDGIPDDAHILVIPTSETFDLPKILNGRIFEPMFLYETQGLSVYKVYPKTDTTTAFLK